MYETLRKKKKHQNIDSKSERDVKTQFTKKAIPRVERQPSEWKVITYKSGIG